jgi:hypothetical protein
MKSPGIEPEVSWSEGGVELAEIHKIFLGFNKAGKPVTNFYARLTY